MRIMQFPFVEPSGQGWTQFEELATAFVLAALIGLEREYRQKSAGLRTYTIIGLAAALMMIISKYGFTNVLRPGHVVLDPSRVAAQIVVGIGFIGGGVIFIGRNVVRGLTTAAIMWLTTGIGMACGAGLPLLAVAATGGHFIVVFGFRWIEFHLPRSPIRSSRIRMTYESGRGVLRSGLAAASELSFTVSDVEVHPGVGGEDVVSVGFSVTGSGDPGALLSRLAKLDGMLNVSWGEIEDAR
jgi:putative Mg2+ transporter-C (MgtC) family protein